MSTEVALGGVSQLGVMRAKTWQQAQGLLELVATLK